MTEKCICCGCKIPKTHQHNRHKCIHCLIYHKKVLEELNRYKYRYKLLHEKVYGSQIRGEATQIYSKRMLKTIRLLPVERNEKGGGTQ